MTLEYIIIEHLITRQRHECQPRTNEPIDDRYSILPRLCRLPVGRSQRFLTRLKNKTHRHDVMPSSCHQPLSTLKKNGF